MPGDGSGPQTGHQKQVHGDNDSRLSKIDGEHVDRLATLYHHQYQEQVAERPRSEAGGKRRERAYQERGREEIGESLFS